VVGGGGGGIMVEGGRSGRGGGRVGGVSFTQLCGECACVYVCVCVCACIRVCVWVCVCSGARRWYQMVIACVRVHTCPCVFVWYGRVCLQELELHPDGNSLDMMQGLVYTKR